LFVITPNRANFKSGGNGPHLFVGQCIGSFLFAARWRKYPAGKTSSDKCE
jgi:hypothetical protein